MQWTLNQYTPYVIGLVVTLFLTLGSTVAGLLLWIFHQVIYQPLKKATADVSAIDHRILNLESAFKYYVETLGRGAAAVLRDSSNPTPTEMQKLLDLYMDGKLDNEADRAELKKWLDEIIESRQWGKFATAIQIRGSLGAQKRMEQK